MTGRIVKSLIGLLVGGVCLWLAFRGVGSTEADTGVSMRDIGARIASVPLSSHIGFAALMIVQFVIRTERWRVQVRGLTGAVPPFRKSLAVNAAAFAAVFLLPFRLGEFVRPNLSARLGIMRASSGMAATVLERAMDGIVTTGFFGVVLLLLKDHAIPGWVRLGGVTALSVFGGAIVFLVVAYVARGRAVALFSRVARLLGDKVGGRITSMFEGFLDGLSCFRRPRDVVAYLAMTVAFWGINALSMWVLMRGMALDVPFTAALFCMCFLVIGMMMPAPPGNVGNFHAFARVALTVFGVALAPAVAYAVLLHAWNTLGVTLWALVFFATRDLTLSGVRSAASEGGGPQPGSIA